MGRRTSRVRNPAAYTISGMRFILFACVMISLFQNRYQHSVATISDILISCKGIIKFLSNRFRNGDGKPMHNNSLQNDRSPLSAMGAARFCKWIGPSGNGFQNGNQGADHEAAVPFPGSHSDGFWALSPIGEWTPAAPGYRDDGDC